MYIWKYKLATNKINISLFELNEKKKIKLLSMKFLTLVCPITIYIIIIRQEKWNMVIFLRFINFDFIVLSFSNSFKLKN